MTLFDRRIECLSVEEVAQLTWNIGLLPWGGLLFSLPCALVLTYGNPIMAFVITFLVLACLFGIVLALVLSYFANHSAFVRKEYRFSFLTSELVLIVLTFLFSALSRSAAPGLKDIQWAVTAPLWLLFLEATAYLLRPLYGLQREEPRNRYPMDVQRLHSRPFHGKTDSSGIGASILVFLELLVSGLIN